MVDLISAVLQLFYVEISYWTSHALSGPHSHILLVPRPVHAYEELNIRTYNLKI